MFCLSPARRRAENLAGSKSVVGLERHLTGTTKFSRFRTQISACITAHREVIFLSSGPEVRFWEVEVWFGPDRRATQKLLPMSGALIALRVSPVLRWGQGLPPLSPLAALFLRCAPDRFLLTKSNTFQHNREVSVATLRWCSGSSRNAVRLPLGTSVQLRRNSQSARRISKNSDPALSRIAGRSTKIMGCRSAVAGTGHGRAICALTDTTPR